MSTRSCGNFIKPVFNDDFVLSGAQLSAHGVAKEGVKVTVTLLNSCIVIVIEAT